jgi:hypothetical protein
MPFNDRVGLNSQRVTLHDLRHWGEGLILLMHPKGTLSCEHLLLNASSSVRCSTLSTRTIGRASRLPEMMSSMLRLNASARYESEGVRRVLTVCRKTPGSVVGLTRSRRAICVAKSLRSSSVAEQIKPYVSVIEPVPSIPYLTLNSPLLPHCSPLQGTGHRKKAESVQCATLFSSLASVWYDVAD